MRHLVVLGMVLAALLSLTSTWALQTATVGGTSLQANVVSTSSALISLVPAATGISSGNRAANAYLVNDVLMLDFRKSANTATGFHKTPAGMIDTTVTNKYSYTGLFSVKNNSDSPLCIWVHVPTQPGPADLAAIYVGAGKVATARGAKLSCAVIDPGTGAPVSFEWSIGSTNATDAPFTVVVEKRLNDQP